MKNKKIKKVIQFYTPFFCAKYVFTKNGRILKLEVAKRAMPMGNIFSD